MELLPTSDTRCWESIPADSLAHILNECGLGYSDAAAIRLACRHWRLVVDAHLKSLAPACTSLEQLSSVAARFPFLTTCDLTRCDTRLVDHASLCAAACGRLSALLAALARMPSLTCLHISDTFAERMGQKHWAALVCAQAAAAAAPAEPRRGGSHPPPDPDPGPGSGRAAAPSPARSEPPPDSVPDPAAAPYPARSEAAALTQPRAASAGTSFAPALDGAVGGAAGCGCDCAGGGGAASTVQPAEAAAVASAAVGEAPAAALAAAACEDAPAAVPDPANPADLADPGVKSFLRAISRAGATHQRAFWLPDWGGRLAGLSELHVRGRQRPPPGLPPCLLWLHAGRTAHRLASLTLSRLSLATLPEQLGHLTALTRLVAQDCALSLLPRGLCPRLAPRLAHLDLGSNCLQQLPPDFTALTALRHLDLQRNKLAALPADIGALTVLTSLLLNNNQLRCLPPSLSALSSLEHLSASYNWLGGMAPALPLLAALPRLARLELACVSDVRCRLVPPQELRSLAPSLTHLDLAANNLVPADVLGTLTSLRVLGLADCGLLAVPPWLRRLGCLARLDLSSNSLADIPPWLAACARLRHLALAHNRLSVRVPAAVLEALPGLVVVEEAGQG